jgi:hypothetical protein
MTRLWSRTARDWSASFPPITAAIGELAVKSVLLDGEAVCLREDGRPDFNRLRSKEGCAEARLMLSVLYLLCSPSLMPHRVTLQRHGCRRPGVAQCSRSHGPPCESDPLRASNLTRLPSARPNPS